MSDWILLKETDPITDRQSRVAEVAMSGGTGLRIRRLWRPSEVELELVLPSREKCGFRGEVWIRLRGHDAILVAETIEESRHASARRVVFGLMRRGDRTPPHPLIVSLLRGASDLVVRYLRGDNEIVTESVSLESLYGFVRELDLQLTD